VLRCVQVERRCREGRDKAAAAAEPTTSWHSLALTCPRTCALCDDASPRTCRLPGAWHGRWTDAATGAAVAINATAMSVVNERKHEFLLRVLQVCCVDPPPRITTSTLPARCYALAPATDMDRKADVIDGTDRRTPNRTVCGQRQ